MFSVIPICGICDLFLLQFCYPNNYLKRAVIGDGWNIGVECDTGAQLS